MCLVCNYLPSNFVPIYDFSMLICTYLQSYCVHYVPISDIIVYIVYLPNNHIVYIVYLPNNHIVYILYLPTYEYVFYVPKN